VQNAPNGSHIFRLVLAIGHDPCFRSSSWNPLPASCHDALRSLVVHNVLPLVLRDKLFHPFLGRDQVSGSFYPDQFRFSLLKDIVLG
jgi:hypothetical protein